MLCHLANWGSFMFCEIGILRKTQLCVIKPCWLKTSKINMSLRIYNSEWSKTNIKRMSWYTLVGRPKLLMSCRKAIVRLPVWTGFLPCHKHLVQYWSPASCPVEGSFTRVKLLDHEADYTSLLSDPVHVCLELHLQSPYLRFLGVSRRVTIKVQ